MKKLIFLTFICVNIFTNAQIKTNDQNQYVYPYKANVNFNIQIVNYFDEMNSELYDVYTDHYFSKFLTEERYFEYDEEDVNASPEKKRELRKKALIEKIEKLRENRAKSQVIESSGVPEKKVLEVYRHNPSSFFRVNNSPEILPYLDTLPDGEYVQYYAPFAYPDVEGKIILKKDVVASKFNMKNNKLNGKIEYFTPFGEKYVEGSYLNGFKEGWFYLIEGASDFYGINKTYYKELKDNNFQIETYNDSINFNFKNNLLDGPYSSYGFRREFAASEGFYKEDRQVGKWIYRDYNYLFDKNNFSEYYYPNELTTVHQAVILKGTINSRVYHDAEDFYFPQDTFVYVNLNTLYQVANDDSENLNIDGEEIDSYIDLQNEEMYEYESYYDEYDYGYDMGMGYDDQYISPKQKLQDSLGIQWLYDQKFVLKNSEGDVLYRTSFENGKKQEEDTLFYPGNIPFCTVAFDEESKSYTKSIFDYNGKLYSKEKYDSLGHFDTILVAPSNLYSIVVDGLEYDLENYSNSYYYYNKDSNFIYSDKDEILLNKSLFAFNLAPSSETIYYPKEKKMIVRQYTINNKIVSELEANFGEDFSFWNGTSKNNFLNFTKLSTVSASTITGSSDYYPDTNKSEMVRSFYYYYDATYETQLLRNGESFSGDLTINYGTKKFKLDNSANKIVVNVPLNKKFLKKAKKDYERFIETGKIKEKSLLTEIPYVYFQGGSFPSFMNEFFNQEGSILAEAPYSLSMEELDYAEEEYYFNEMEGLRNMKFEDHEIRKLTGAYSEGKPANLWYAYDSKDRLVSQYSFINGDLNGEAKKYQIQQAFDLNWYYGMESSMEIDSFPVKPTLYLAVLSNYKDGRLDGVYENYDWLGNVTDAYFYQYGLLQGKSYSKNKYTYATTFYKDSELDGATKMYFIKNPQDSILMYDLNFKNGALQGESRAYHTNGKLANKGFFLNGQPIDDYESYDSLGFRYQYVKFQFNQPIEEKVWELNELSVKYEFDWRDSLMFNPSDIVDINSFRNLLYELGLAAMDEYYQPYYGRERLINKGKAKYILTKYFPNGQIARTGTISNSKKTECWKTYDYYGNFLYEINYFDTIVEIENGPKFKSKGVYYTYDKSDNLMSKSYIIEKREKYDCSHSDHYEVRQFYTIYQNPSDTLDRMNGYILNYYDNGTIQSEGKMQGGLPTGIWKFYDAQGNLNEVGTYNQGKRNGRWLGGDLTKTRFLGEICLNPNMPNLEEEIAYREKQLNIVITNYDNGKALNKEFYDVDLNKIVTEE